MKSSVQLREDAAAIFHAGLKAADPVDAIRRHMRLEGDVLKIAAREYDLAGRAGVFVVGAGKASARMAVAVEELLGARLSGGVVNVKYGHSVPLKIVKINEAGHPLPDEAGVEGTKEIIELLKARGEEDLVLFLVSGGGSALLPCPADGLTLHDKQQTTKALLDCGATIQEINAIRKHVSKVKGGHLARLAYPATLVSLILSDVIGDSLDAIASGPTVPDTSTFADCLRIVERYGIGEKIPAPVARLLDKGKSGQAEETPKAGDAVFRNVQNVIVGSNRLAIAAAREKAEALGYHSLVLSSFIQGETKEAAGVHVAIAKEILSSGNPVPRPACVISGGETTVTIRGDGLGGRNQEFTLAAALGLDGLEGVVALSGGTDGTDGPTDAAGAVADGATVRRAKDKGLDAEEFLRRNDSYRYFQPLGDLLMTGPTQTNVMDLRLILTG